MEIQSERERMGNQHQQELRAREEQHNAMLLAMRAREDRLENEKKRDMNAMMMKMQES